MANSQDPVQSRSIQKTRDPTEMTDISSTRKDKSNM